MSTDPRPYIRLRGLSPQVHLILGQIGSRSTVHAALAVKQVVAAYLRLAAVTGPRPAGRSLAAGDPVDAELRTGGAARPPLFDGVCSVMRLLCCVGGGEKCTRAIRAVRVGSQSGHPLANAIDALADAVPVAV